MLKANLERRNYHRIVIDSPVQVTGGGLNIIAICRDLSASGMLLELPKRYFSLDDNIRIFLPAGDSRVQPLQAEARVMRIDYDGDNCQIGVEFNFARPVAS